MKDQALINEGREVAYKLIVDMKKAEVDDEILVRDGGLANRKIVVCKTLEK